MCTGDVYMNKGWRVWLCASDAVVGEEEIKREKLSCVWCGVYRGRYWGKG